MFMIVVKKCGPASFADAFSDEFWARYNEEYTSVPLDVKLTRRDPLMIRLVTELSGDAGRFNAIFGIVSIPDEFAEDYRVVNEPSMNCDRVELFKDEEWVFYSY
jgi:hypothetical protein